jgi:hypothetical protein
VLAPARLTSNNRWGSVFRSLGWSTNGETTTRPLDMISVSDRCRKNEVLAKLLLTQTLTDVIFAPPVMVLCILVAGDFHREGGMDRGNGEAG